MWIFLAGPPQADPARHYGRPSVVFLRSQLHCKRHPNPCRGAGVDPPVNPVLFLWRLIHIGPGHHEALAVPLHMRQELLSSGLGAALGAATGLPDWWSQTWISPARASSQLTPHQSLLAVCTSCCRHLPACKQASDGYLSYLLSWAPCPSVHGPVQGWEPQGKIPSTRTRGRSGAESSSDSTCTSGIWDWTEF